MAITQVSNHSELISALNSASPADTIECFEGNYSGNIDDITKSSYVNIVAATGQVPNFGFKRIRRCSYLNFYQIQFIMGGLYVNANGDPDGGSIVNEQDGDHLRFEECNAEGRDKCWKFSRSNELDMLNSSADRAGQGCFTFDGLTNSRLIGLHGGHQFFMHPSVHGDFGQFSGTCFNNLIEKWRLISPQRYPVSSYPNGNPADLIGKIVQFCFVDNGNMSGFIIRNNIGHTNAVGLIWDGSSVTNSDHTVEFNTCLSSEDNGNTPTIGLAGVTNAQGNIAGAGGQINIDRGEYDQYYAGLGTPGVKTIEDFAIVPGSPAETNGAHALINELLNTGGNPPMAIVYSLETQATNGTTAVNADGTWTYDPNTNYAGNESWQYRATDDVFNTFSIGTMTGNVVAPVPSAPDGSFTVDANTQASGDLKTL